MQKDIIESINKMEKPYFVMLLTPDGEMIPMVNHSGDVAFYNHLDQAENDAMNSDLGKTFGWECFESGLGVLSG